MVDGTTVFHSVEYLVDTFVGFVVLLGLVTPPLLYLVEVDLALPGADQNFPRAVGIRLFLVVECHRCQVHL